VFSRALWVALAVGLACLALPRTTDAAVETVTGFVKAAPAGAEEAATVKVGAVVYKITNDANGKTVAKEAANKKVEIKGNVTQKGGVKWIAVTSCKIVE